MKHLDIAAQRSARIERQRQIIESFIARGDDPILARAVLFNLEDAARLFRERLLHLADALKGHPGSTERQVADPPSGPLDVLPRGHATSVGERIAPSDRLISRSRALLRATRPFP